jgi:hypothetical protein
MKLAAFLLVVAVASAVALVGAWGIRLHQIQNINRKLCMTQERTNTALRLVLDARLQDPGTSDVVKAKFRAIETTYLRPVDCRRL